MAGTPGYTKVIQCKTTGSTAYTVLPANSATFNFPRALLDDTTFASTGWMSRLAGLKDYSFNLSAIYNSTDAGIGIIRSAIINGTKLDVQYLPNGTAGVYGQVYVESYGLSGDVSGLESLDSVLQSAGTAISTV